MASRTLSWEQQVSECDPDYKRLLLRPYWYQFSNGKEFDWNGPGIYTQNTP